MRKPAHLLALATGALAALAIAAPASAAPGAVYMLTNATGGNAVNVYDRASDGSLSFAVSVPTAGAGLGASLASQGAVVVSQDGQWLFAVNAGSNSVSAFRIQPNGLELTDVAPSGGIRPTSVTYRKGVLYVLNAGTPNTISGFHVVKGDLQPIAGSTQPLAVPAANAAQVAISNDGGTLVVTERATNRLMTFTLDANDAATNPGSYPSVGFTPYGFVFTKANTIFVSDAAAPSGASTYSVNAGVITPITGLLGTGQSAACWAVVTRNGKFGYVANAATSNISGFRIADDGSLSLLDANGVTATMTGGPTDIALDESSHFLYVRNSSSGRINAYAVEPDGSLTPLDGIGGISNLAAGIAAR